MKGVSHTLTRGSLVSMLCLSTVSKKDVCCSSTSSILLSDAWVWAGVEK